MKKQLLKDFTPQLFISLKTYDKEKFMHDLMAGLIVGIVALPLALAFGIASGVTPEQGIITAIIAGFIISFLGGSRVQIGGPTGAFIVIVYGVVQTHGIKGLLIATIIAGIILILLGVFKLGKIIKFIPYPIIVGFTSGIAVTIFTTQIADIFGLNFGGEKVPGDFIGKWIIYFKYIHTINWWNTLISIASILIIVFTPRIIKKIPGSLVAIILITVAVYLLKTYFGINAIDTIGDRFRIIAELPAAEIPNIDMAAITDLLPVAITIAMLGAIESLLSATVADGVIGGEKHNSNTELIAQGVANIITPLFGGIPATGAIARTMTNINNGGRTPVAGIIHAVVLLLILLLLMPLAQYIPMACLAGVLVIVAYNMSEWRTFRGLLKDQKSDVAVLLITFFLTVIFDLTIAIEVGIVLAVILFMRRINEVSTVSVIRDQLDLTDESEYTQDEEILKLPEGVEVYEIDGPFFFGIANKFEESMRIIGDKSRVRIIRMRKVPFIDSTGLNNLETLCKKSMRDGIQVILSGVRPEVRAMIRNSEIPQMIGQNNICDNINIALERSNEVLRELDSL
ncbi:sulfate permease [Dysgonomonas sp. Marseille-P4677]|uniref:SulP family inorganic anion transporter n=1 Tax=Dysgonomonas sp. Marseille-P4677 TaxID=2364790 RepID=UPI00191301BB|nr:sulfate permease [Dysgonomonas sp. Marseille-P4677]MBK5722680.1 sulfate permease [Dysgonomonas sp. Marseille-P4677]